MLRNGPGAKWRRGDSDDGRNESKDQLLEVQREVKLLAVLRPERPIRCNVLGRHCTARVLAAPPSQSAAGFRGRLMAERWQAIYNNV